MKSAWVRAIGSALVVGVCLTGCLRQSKPLSQQPGYGAAHYKAQLYCSMSVNAGLYSDEMTRCVKQTTVAYMKGNTP